MSKKVSCLYVLLSIGFIMLLIISCKVSGIDNSIRESDVYLYASYDKTIIDEYSDFFDGEVLRYKRINEIPREMLSKISTTTLFYDIVKNIDGISTVVGIGDSFSKRIEMQSDE